MPEHKLINGMSNCLHCGFGYEPGDRFCQDCGNVVPREPARPAPRPAGKFALRLPISADRLPAEIILIGAAVVYIASAALWSSQSQIKAWLSHFKLPTIKVDKGAAHAVTAPNATEGGAQLPAPEVQSLQPTTQSTKDSKHDSAVHQQGQRAEVTQTTTHKKHTDEVAAQATSPTALPEKTPSAGKEEIEDVAEYNRLLAQYFETPPEQGQARKEPPSYIEWVAAGKPQF